MGEIIHEAIQWYNLPLTALLGIVALYWSLVAFGLLDSEWMGLDMDADIDADIDVDVDVDADADIDTDVDSHHDFDPSAVAHTGSGSLGDLGLPLLKFVNAHEVPLTIVGSLMALFLWGGSLIANHYFNPDGGALIAGGLFAADFVLGAVLTRIVTSPLIPLMRGLKKGAREEVKVVGHVGTVKTGEITATYGQVEIDIAGSPILVQARSPEGAPPLSRGDEVMVIDHEDGTEIYTVRKTEPMKLN